MSQEILMGLERFLVAESRSSINTVKGYLADVKIFLSYLTKKAKKVASQATYQDCEKFLLEQAKKGSSSSTMLRRIASLKKLDIFMHSKLGKKLLDKELMTVKKSFGSPKFLTKEQVDRLLEQLTTRSANKTFGPERNKVIFLLLYSLGLRVSELVELRINAIDLDQKVVKILGKGNKERVIPISEDLLPTLRNFLELRSQELAENSSFPFLIFSIRDKKPQSMTRQALNAILSELAMKSGLDQKISPHWLRHTIATHLLHEGADLRTLQSFLGHSSIKTVQVYTHVDLARLRSVYVDSHPRK